MYWFFSVALVLTLTGCIDCNQGPSREVSRLPWFVVGDTVRHVATGEMGVVVRLARHDRVYVQGSLKHPKVEVASIALCLSEPADTGAARSPDVPLCQQLRQSE